MIDLSLFHKVIGIVFFQWHIGPYWQTRIKNLSKVTCKKKQRNVTNECCVSKLIKKWLFSFIHVKYKNNSIIWDENIEK
jgi:hypothetical protein